MAINMMVRSIMGKSQDIAVIGSGIAGLSCAWLLREAGHSVTVFEKDAHVAGHGHTIDISTSAGTTAVDIAPVVFNEQASPNSRALFERLGVATQFAEIAFSVSLDRGSLEYSDSDAWHTLFAQKRNILRPRFWQMLRDCRRFERCSVHWRKSLPETLTLAELLDREQFSAGFCEDYLLPLAAAIWSMSIEQMRAYPAVQFLDCCLRHRLLEFGGRSQWRSVVGASREYVAKLTAGYADAIELNCAIVRVERFADHVVLCDEQGKRHRFDQVVFACHADQALAMLAEPSAAEAKTLAAFGYQDSRVMLHGDTRLLPKRQDVWSSWNIAVDRRSGRDQVSMNYWMNSLQRLPCAETVVVSVNPVREPRDHQVFAECRYRQPVVDDAALWAQANLPALQGKQHSWFCGDYFGCGFHEDGIQAGLAVAERLSGVSRPWSAELSTEGAELALSAPAMVSA